MRRYCRTLKTPKNMGRFHYPVEALVFNMQKNLTSLLKIRAEAEKLNNRVGEVHKNVLSCLF